MKIKPYPMISHVIQFLFSRKCSGYGTSFETLTDKTENTIERRHRCIPQTSQIQDQASASLL